MTPLDIALVGVPKSGTSSLYTALAAHPDIQGSEPKETFYFTDRPFAKPTRAHFREGGWPGFDAFFPGARDDRKRLEATTISLYQDIALDMFAALKPQPLIVVGLRCPAHQIRSHFYYNRSYGRIDESLDFVTYARALLDHDSEVLTAAIHDDVERAIYAASLDWNHYARWLDRWCRKISDERLVIVTQRQIGREPVEVLQSICRRLGIDESFYNDYEAPRINVTRAGVVKDVGPIARAGRRLLPSGAVRDLAARWNQRRRLGASLGPPTPAEEEVLEELGRLFQPHNEDLAERYQVDITGWRPLLGSATR